jgi:hypothetical protein
MIHMDESHVRLLHDIVSARMIGLKHLTNAKNNSEGYIVYIVVMEYIRNNKHLIY